METKLMSPTNLTITDNILEFDAVENAETYRIYAGSTLLGAYTSLTADMCNVSVVVDSDKRIVVTLLGGTGVYEIASTEGSSSVPDENLIVSIEDNLLTFEFYQTSFSGNSTMVVNISSGSQMISVHLDVTYEAKANSAKGTWRFNDPLYSMNKTINVTYYVNFETVDEGVSTWDAIDITDQAGSKYAPAVYYRLSGGPSYPAYVNSLYSWSSTNRGLIKINSGDDIENPDLIAWLEANAMRIL